MGQGGSQAEAPGVDRCSFSDAEYDALRKTLEVADDVPTFRVELASFVARFPSHLRPLVQPMFFQLGRERVGEHSAAWGVLKPSLSQLMRGRGTTWQELLQAWADSSGAGADLEDRTSAAPTKDELLLYLELATLLCYWSAYPVESPQPGEVSGDKAVAGSGAHRVVSVLSASLADFDSLVGVAGWLESCIPMMPRAVGPRIASALLGDPARQLQALESRVLDSDLALLLRSMDARLWESGSWAPLYRDWCDGRSFNGLIKGTLHYDGPALLLVKTDQGEVLGAMSTSWNEGHGKFGGSTECFLFALLPTLVMCRSSSRSGNYAYLNSRNKHAPRGLGFGGQIGFCRLWLDADFEDCFVLEGDATYAAGRLLPGTGLQTHFQVSHVEVWGCGGAEAVAAQAVRRARDEGFREKARTVDRAKLIESEFDKEMFFGNTFSASAGSRETDCREVESTAEGQS